MIREKTFKTLYRAKILQKYYDAVGTDSAMARNYIKMLNFGDDPYLLRCIAQTYFDESLFHEDGSYREYFDRRKLRLAEKYIILAFKLNDECIDVLYTMGEIRNGLGQKDLAIFCFEKVIANGAKKIPKSDTCTDRSLVEVIVNDSKFQLYRLHHDLGNFDLSRRYLNKYKRGLRKGLNTIFKPIEEFLMD